MRLFKTLIILFLAVQSLPLSSSAEVLPALSSTVQQNYNPLGGPQYPLVQSSYFTDDNGNILMIVNVIGEVNRQGQMVVKESVDFATILALAGGIRPEANLKQVLVARQEPDKDGKQAYIINLKDFYKHGDRSAFIALKPNDTIIIPEKSISIYKLASIMSIAYPWVSIYSVLHNNANK